LGSVLGYYVRTDVIIVLYTLPVVTVTVEALFPLLHYHYHCNIIIVIKKLKEKFGSSTRKTLDKFTTKDSYSWNITHNTESNAV